MQRWQVESTFQEVRAHLGVETQRQWTDLAIPRTTPALLGLFSLVTLLAHPHMSEQPARPAGGLVRKGPDLLGRAGVGAAGDLGSMRLLHVR